MKSRLGVGDTVPDFWVRDINGREVDSKKLNGYTLLAFLRYAGCPFCNLAVHRLTHEYANLKKLDCEVVAFIQSTEDEIEKNIFSRHADTPDFAIISDHDQDFYRMFSVVPNKLKMAAYTVAHAPQWMDAAYKKGFKQAGFKGDGAIVPAYFLIDQDGRIMLADYSADFYDDSTFELVYERLKASV